MILIDIRATGFEAAKPFFENLHARNVPLVFCSTASVLPEDEEKFALEHGAVVYGHAEDDTKFWGAVFRNYPNATALVAADTDYTAVAVAMLDDAAPALKLSFDTELQQFVVVR